MHAGQVLHPYVWSLGAFWPGLQALAGQVDEGAALHANWTAAWHKFGWCVGGEGEERVAGSRRALVAAGGALGALRCCTGASTLLGSSPSSSPL